MTTSGFLAANGAASNESRTRMSNTCPEARVSEPAQKFIQESFPRGIEASFSCALFNFMCAAQLSRRFLIPRYFCVRLEIVCLEVPVILKFIGRTRVARLINKTRKFRC